MSETIVKPKAGRLSALQKITREREETNTALRENAFQSRVAMHQFMNHNAAIFHDLARAQASNMEFAADTVREAAEDARALAVRVAARVLGKAEQDVEPADAKPFRTEAAALLVELRASGSKVDVTAIADAIAAATKLADPQWDFDAFKDLRISADASVAMTAAAAVATLTKQVMVYGFRRDPNEVLGRLTRAVTEASAAAGRQMMPAESSDEERRMMLQTLTKHFAGLMEACYERHARSAVARLSRLDEAARINALQESDPIVEIVGDFNDWAVRFGGFALAAGRDVIDASRARSNPPNAP